MVGITDYSQGPGDMVLINNRIRIDFVDLRFGYFMVLILNFGLIRFILNFLFGLTPFPNLALD